MEPQRESLSPGFSPRIVLAVSIVPSQSGGLFGKEIGSFLRRPSGPK